MNHEEELIHWCYDEVVSAGGDGDGIWFSKNIDVKELFPMVQKQFAGWDVSMSGKTILCSRNQESFVVTNDESEYKNRPNWQQFSIEY